MIRTFETHKIRKTRELSSCLWNFHTVTAEGNGPSIPVAVPSCWETYPETVNYRGKGSYSRAFEAGGNIRLEFKGVSHTATVCVDGKRVTTHYNAYTPFDVVLKDLEQGTHELEVVADNSFGPDSALHIPNDYQSYGGISRGVILEELGEIYIKWVHFTPIWKGSWHSTVQMCLCNLSDRPYTGVVKLSLDGEEFLPVRCSLTEEKQDLWKQRIFPLHRWKAGHRKRRCSILSVQCSVVLTALRWMT